MTRHRAGDEGALREMLGAHGPLLRRVVRIRMLARMRALLASSRPPPEFLLRVLRRFHAGDPESAAEVLEWLARLAEGWVCDHPEPAPARDAGPRLTFGAPDGGGGGATAGARPDPVAARRVEYEELVDRHVEGLEPNELREALLLRDYLGMDWKAIADALELPDEEEARVLHRRAHEELRRLLRPYLR